MRRRRCNGIHPRREGLRNNYYTSCIKERDESVMRKNFADVLKSANIDIKREYSKLYGLFYGKDKRDNHSLADLISMNFESIHFRGTCLDLEDFNQQYGFNFVKQPQEFNIDYLVSFCEYVYNFVLAFHDNFFFNSGSKMFYIQHINKVIDAIGYMKSEDDGFVIFVEKNQAAISVSEIVPKEISYKVISYNHYSMRGDIDGKKAILLILANQLEPQEKKLNQIDATFKSELFFALNNFNIRHNNVDPSDKRYYKKAVAEMTDEELEHWYDETYQMCLLAFLRIDHLERKKAINELKQKVESKDGNT